MAGVKIATFLGKAPKISPELLPNTAAQIAENCKLYSGDLIPYPQPVVVANTNRTGVLKTLYALRNPSNPNDLKWLSWTTEVDIAIASANLQDEQRFYYTGDGAPKVSNYELATAGVPPYPTNSYDLGLPIPPDSDTLITTAQLVGASTTTASYARAANIATIVTSTPHGLQTNDIVNINGFTVLTGTGVLSIVGPGVTIGTAITINGHGLSSGAIVSLSGTTSGTYTVTVLTPDVFTIPSLIISTLSEPVTLSLTSFNNTAAQVTRVDDVTFTYTSVGFASTTVAYTSGGVGKSSISTQSRARDAGNTATITTIRPHELRTGNIVTITGFPAGTSTVATFNAANIEVTVVDAFTLTYFSPGEIVSTTVDTDGKVTLAGLTQARSYVFTWYTPWEEESIASKPSDDLFIKEGITVTVANLPIAKPAGNNFVRGVRLYRTLPTLSGTEYFRLATLWFPTALSAVQRTSNVSRVTLAFPHNLSIDDRFKISGCTVASFDITDGIVTDVVDDYTFEYAQAAANVALTSVGAGTLFHDVAETLTDPARYWGDAGNYDFTDDFDARNLLNVLGSDEYDAPPPDLQGLVTHKNNILVGFVGNTLYFSEPALPHAWPNRYATPVGSDIVALASIAGALLVLTKSYPYIISTNDPAAGVSVERIDAVYPCLNARSVVAMGYGIVWSTVDGLAVYSPNSGPALVTKALYNNDTWSVDVDPASVIAEYYGENYFASHSQGSFVFEQDSKVGGFFVDTVPVFTASWYDAQTGNLYYTNGTLGDVFQWDDLSQPALTMQWKSKVIITKDMINIGAARVIADYSVVTTTWDAATQQWNAALTNWNNADEITFKLWVDKQLIFTTTVNDTGVFRLPSGYRTDTFEVGVEGNVRVRAIHLAETSLGLREV